MLLFGSGMAWLKFGWCTILRSGWEKEGAMWGGEGASVIVDDVRVPACEAPAHPAVRWLHETWIPFAISHGIIAAAEPNARLSRISIVSKRGPPQPWDARRVTIGLGW